MACWWSLTPQASAYPGDERRESDAPARLGAPELAAPPGFGPWPPVMRGMRAGKPGFRLQLQPPARLRQHSQHSEEPSTSIADDLRLAAGLGARSGSVSKAGKFAAENLAGRVVNPREALRDHWDKRPLITGLAIGVAVGAYVGWEALTDGRMAGSYTFDAGEVGLSFSGSYDLQTGDWTGRAQIDLSELVDGD